MRGRKIIRTTLGELIVAVTDEVMPIIRDRSAISVVVSYILSDLLAHQHVRVHTKRNEIERGSDENVINNRVGYSVVSAAGMGGRRSAWRPGSSNGRQAPGDPQGSPTEGREQKE
jgi:hypothetical protein